VTERQPRLRAGVIAAGHGERLQAAGPFKPLVMVAGRPLIDRVLESIGEAGAEEVAIIINAASSRIREHVSAARWPFPIRWIVETTPSSMHSFLLVLEALSTDTDEPVLISTVDTIVREGAFTRFVESARTGSAAVTLALTSVVDDEKPLLVSIDGRHVTAIGDAASGSPLATAGYYFVDPVILKEADSARRNGLSALRSFLARLLACGYPIDGVLMPDSIDVDRPQDVSMAEHLLG
jgi:NDP-sugar pyrophosphorylase family protein